MLVDADLPVLVDDIGEPVAITTARTYLDADVLTEWNDSPWGFPLSQIDTPVSVWYGPDDVLSPRGHAEWLIAHIPGAERRELPSGGHLLDDEDLDSRYAWLTSER